MDISSFFKFAIFYQNVACADVLYLADNYVYSV